MLVLSVALCSCMTFPLPPSDVGPLKTGALGRLRVYLACKWLPAELPPTDGLKK